MGSPASSPAAIISAESFFQYRLLLESRRGIDSLIDRSAELCFEVSVKFTRIFAGFGHDLGSQKVLDTTVLARGQFGTVSAQEKGPGSLFTAKSEFTVLQPIHEPFEPYRDFAQFSLEVICHPFDDRSRHQRFAYSSRLSPFRSVLEQIPYGYRQIMIGIEQAGAFCNIVSETGQTRINVQCVRRRGTPYFELEPTLC